MKALAPVDQATHRYQEWLEEFIPVLKGDLEHKYRKMRSDPTGFVFFRGTFYRWVKLWENKRKELRERGVLIGGAPELFCVGDLHIENFGTWRDSEGRLVWGINDFDEAFSMRYISDLVRLATSALLALEGKTLPWKLSSERICAAILDGYGTGLESEGRPIVLERHISWLWKIAIHPSRAPEQFWLDLEAKLKPEKNGLPEKVLREAANALGEFAPRGSKGSPLFRRRAGVGSLGRPRFVQFFTGKDGQVVRETKAIAPSACVFAGMGKPVKNPYRKVLENAVRSADPIFGVVDGWVVRRLAYDSMKIAVESLNTITDAVSIFQAMGAEVANIHLGDSEAADARRHLRAQNQKRADWLLRSAEEMVVATKRDFQDYLNSEFGKSEEER